MSEQGPRAEFSDSDIAGLAPAMKIGLLATVNTEGLPHVTLLSSLRAASATTLTFGQFTEGVSKRFIKGDPRAAFLVMSLQKELWRGTARFTHTAQAGTEYDGYNNEPLFRYNAYFGIHTVYFLDLVGHTGRQPLPMGGIVAASLATALARVATGPSNGCAALNPWTRSLMSAMGNLKFASYVSADGFPRIIPILQAQAVSRDRVVFSLSVYRDELAAIPLGTPVAVFGMTLKMEDVLMRGKYAGVRRMLGVPCGVVEIDWVYNSMPPVPGQVFPPVELSAVPSVP
jgi:hypothetical protein